jgi:hypothetical protein
MRESRSPQPYFPVSESRRAGVVHLASACVKRCMSDLAWRGLLYVALLPPNSRARVASLSPAHAAAHIDTGGDDDCAPTERREILLQYYCAPVPRLISCPSHCHLEAGHARRHLKLRPGFNRWHSVTDRDASGRTDKTTLVAVHTPLHHRTWLLALHTHTSHHAFPARTLVIAGGGAGAAHHRHDVGGESLRNGEFTRAHSHGCDKY